MFTGREEGIQTRVFEFEHLPNARLTDEDDENENRRDNVEYVGEQGTFETRVRHESDDLRCPWNTHQQKETQDHFKSASIDLLLALNEIRLKP